MDSTKTSFRKSHRPRLFRICHPCFRSVPTEMFSGVPASRDGENDGALQISYMHVVIQQ